MERNWNGGDTNDEPERPTVLAVDDEEAQLSAYVSWLEDSYDVRTATDGEAALDALDASVDAVLLDRRMPGPSGRRVLEEIKDRDFDCHVAMVSAVEPDLDVIDMEFDDYLVKPVTKDEVRDIVETLLTRRSLDEQLRECYALVSKKATLEVTMDRDDLESTTEYRELEERISSAEAEADECLDELIDRDAVVGAYDDVLTES